MNNLSLRHLRTKLGNILTGFVLGAALLFALPYSPVSPVKDSFAVTTSAAPRIRLLPDPVALTIAEYTQSNAPALKKILRMLGANNEVLPDDFDKFSPIEQLQWAYASVEIGEEGAGKKMAAAFVRNVANEVPSITSDTTIMTFLDGESIPTSSFVFSKLASNTVIDELPPDVAKVIAIVSDVLSAGGHGVSARRIMERHLGLSSQLVLESILQFKSGKEALIDQLSRLPEPPQKKKLAEISLEIMNKIPAARSDLTLGEAIQRWLGLGDKTYGEWFLMREEMIEAVEQGMMNLSVEKKRKAQAIVSKLRSDFSRMPGRFLDSGWTLRPKDIERMFFEYSQRNPGVAALWGFSVISMKVNFDHERYVKDQAASYKKQFGQIELTADWDAEARKHGPMPYQGYLEYARVTGFQSFESAGEYFSSPAVSQWVDDICPAKP